MNYAPGKCIAFASAVTLLTACGGGSGSDDFLESAQSPGGIWLGQVETVDGETYEAAGLISESGELRFVVSDGEQTVGKIKVSGTSFSGPITAYSEEGFENGKTWIEGSVSGNIIARKALNGTAKYAGETVSTFTFAYDDVYERNSSLDTISGTYATSDGASFVSYAVQTDGSITGSNTDGCQFNGKFSMLNSSYNLYRMNLKVSSCGDSNGDYAGLASLIELEGQELLVVSATGPTYVITGYIPRS